MALNELANTGQTNIHINLTTNNLIASNFLFTAHPLKFKSRKPNWPSNWSDLMQKEAITVCLSTAKRSQVEMKN